MARETIAVPLSGGEIRFQNGTSLTSPGGAGTATQFVPDPSRLRGGRLPAESETTPEFDRALAEAGFVEQETIHLDVAPQPSQLRGSPAADRMTLRASASPADTAPRVVLYQDESGGLSWHFEARVLMSEEELERRRRRGLRAPRPAEFDIPLRGGPARRTLGRGLPQRSLRGPITKVGRKILKVFLVPAAAAIARPVEDVIGAVERRVRYNRLWRLTPATYTTPPTAEFDGWQSWRGKHCLLLVHGIFSTVEGMLSRLAQRDMQRWCDKYEGRVLGLNHQSVALSPEDNARFFLETLRAAVPDSEMTFDIVCHSRGGIVARTLVERGQELLPELNGRFGKVFFVATPNHGSILGNPDHIVDMIDVFTNFLTNFPDGPTLYSIEVLLAIVKLVAMAGGQHLPGVATMGTSGYIAQVLNAGTRPAPAAYAAAASNYSPVPGMDNGYLMWRFADAVLDRVFREGDQAVANDLVVPFRGVWEANGHPSFPIAEPLLFDREDGVWHAGFFSRVETIRAIDEHLGIVSDPIIVESAAPHVRTGGLRGIAVAPAPGPAVASGDAVVQREPKISFHEQVTEGDTWPLQVELRESGEINALSILIASGMNEVTLSAEISAPGFEVIGPRHVPLVVRTARQPELEKVVFTLKAAYPGPQPVTREIVVTFWDGNSALGTVSHRTVVVPRAYGKPAPLAGESTFNALAVPAQRRESPDVVIYLRSVAGAQETFSLSMRSVVLGEEYEDTPFGTFALGGTDMATYFVQAIDPVFAAFPSAYLSETDFDRELERWNAKLLVELRDLGARLWQLLPKEFRHEYLRLMQLPNPPRSLCIHSDEMVFPWELVQPSGVVSGAYQELPALGISHILGRWKVGLSARPQPQAIPSPRVAIVNPQYAEDALPWSVDERTALQQLLPNVEVISPVTRRSVDQLLARADLRLVHFTGHGDFERSANADLAALRLENGEQIRAIGFASNRLGAEGHPILCLNACTIGRVAQVIGRPGGFAANCLEAGWSGLIAPYWPVYDPKAYEFSLRLYKKLRFGRSIGEALQEIRQDHQDDPTVLSYSYFGDPFARFLFA